MELREELADVADEQIGCVVGGVVPAAVVVVPGNDVGVLVFGEGPTGESESACARVWGCWPCTAPYDASSAAYR
ncbi:hypothetical protein [Micromonospora sp. CPCC 206061]|uniref:hypothetical protein n=1 Tax=Micromonospora sp. CPCC 206061 TaxID=3122410 RepID=UPI002FF05B97